MKYHSCGYYFRSKHGIYSHLYFYVPGSLKSSLQTGIGIRWLSTIVTRKSITWHTRSMLKMKTSTVLSTVYLKTEFIWKHKLYLIGAPRSFNLSIVFTCVEARCDCTDQHWSQIAYSRFSQIIGHLSCFISVCLSQSKDSFKTNE